MTADCQYWVPAQSTIYLTGVSTPLTREVAPRTELLGLLATPDSGVAADRALYRHWAADNGCFSEHTTGRPFNPDRWLGWLERTEPDGCLFACLPDRISGPDGPAAATLERSMPYSAHVRQLGYPAALVAQNGLTPAMVPWDEIDALFIGGFPECPECRWMRPFGDKTNLCPTCGRRLVEWKLSADASRLAHEARARGKWSHLGRVNSWKRVDIAAGDGYDSVDGTYLQFGPDVNGPKLLAWLARLDRSSYMVGQEHRFVPDHPVWGRDDDESIMAWLTFDVGGRLDHASFDPHEAETRRLAADHPDLVALAGWDVPRRLLAAARAAAEREEVA